MLSDIFFAFFLILLIAASIFVCYKELQKCKSQLNQQKLDSKIELANNQKFSNTGNQQPIRLFTIEEVSEDEKSINSTSAST